MILKIEIFSLERPLQIRYFVELWILRLTNPSILSFKKFGFLKKKLSEMISGK